MFTLFFGAMALIVSVIVIFGFYIFAAYVFARLAEKFRVGSFIRFLIPFYNIMLLCDCARVTRWLAAALIAPGITASILNMLSLGALEGVISSAGAVIGFAANVWLWGSIAQRLGKNFWLWGIITPVLVGLPVLILAFDGSMPPLGRSASSAKVTVDGETKYIDV